MIVVDTNVLVYFLVAGTFTRDAEHARARDGEWLAPSLIRHELLNVLSLYVRRGEMELDDAARTYRRGLSLVHIAEAEPDARRVMQLVQQSGCSSYDAQFIVTAMDAGIDLVTADQPLAAAFPDVAMLLSTFAGVR